MEQRLSHRRTHRYPVAWDAHCRVDGRLVEGRLRNVSMGGAFLEMDAPPPITGRELFVLVVHTDFGPMRLEARGCWSSEESSRHGVGVRFLEEPGHRMQQWYRQRWHEQLTASN